MITFGRILFIKRPQQDTSINLLYYKVVRICSQSNFGGKFHLYFLCFSLSLKDLHFYRYSTGSKILLLNMAQDELGQITQGVVFGGFLTFLLDIKTEELGEPGWLSRLSGRLGLRS